MALTLRNPPAPAKPPTTPPRRSAAPQGRKPFFDNTPVLLAGILGLMLALAGLLALGSRSSALAPDFLADVVLYALSATNLTILVALTFVLARNIVKLVVERRRALPFARFRFKLVTVLLGMTLIPAVLVLIVGSELIRNNVDRWFNADLDQVLSSANSMAGDYYAQQQRLVSAQAQRFARSLSTVDLAGNSSAVRDLVAPDVLQERIDLVEVYRIGTSSEPGPPLVPVLDVAAPSIPRQYSRASADRLAERAAASGSEARAVEQVSGSGDLIRTAIPIRSSP
jgi:nitrogen fixation/metabolism regulation signal transduction histidine kinase